MVTQEEIDLKYQVVCLPDIFDKKVVSFEGDNTIFILIENTVQRIRQPDCVVAVHDQIIR